MIQRVGTVEGTFAWCFDTFILGHAPILACWLWFLDNLLFFSILNKHEDNFHNSKLMKCVRLIHARSIGSWWEPTYVIFSLIVWLLYLISLPHSVTSMWLFYTCALTLSLTIALSLWLRYASYPTVFIDSFIIVHVLLSYIWLLFNIHINSINCHACFLLFSRDPFLGT